jgi:hypothetical protein
MDLNKAQMYASEALLDKRDPFVLAVPKIYENLGPVGMKWALVVGVSRFQPDIGAEPLDFAANDANAFAQLLKDPDVGRFTGGDKHVMLLTDSRATTAAVKARLNRIAANAKPEDLVVVYISTHGSPRADDLRGVSYLYTYDTDVTGRDQIFGSALAMVEISGILSTRCRAQRTVVIFDTCHSGATAGAQALSAEDLDRLREGAGRYILMSCEENQKSYEDAGNGFFTATLIEVLQNRRGCIRMSELFSEVRDAVSRKVQERHQKEQRPVLARSEQSVEIVLGSAPSGQEDPCTVNLTKSAV